MKSGIYVAYIPCGRCKFGLRVYPLGSADQHLMRAHFQLTRSKTLALSEFLKTAAGSPPLVSKAKVTGWEQTLRLQVASCIRASLIHVNFAAPHRARTDTHS